MMNAARVETRRIMAENKGDFVSEQRAILARLTAAELITVEEAETLLSLYKTGFEAGEPRGDAQRAYFESRKIHAKMLAGTHVSPVALVIAAAAVGSFELSEGDDGTTTVTMARQSYGQAGAAIGAGIGSLLGGPAGAVLGGEIGGVIGGIIDDKKGKA
ncbi:hypothetical protein AL755_10395 [Arthrobacter sp. ERGS1:01]|nr:hypothetical protein AL755_10395 [Arthrobacter sp. ERGS1:01]